VIVVPTDGSKIVAVQRTDLDLDDVKARELAIADNRSSEIGLIWNPEVLGMVASEGDLSPFFTEGELADILRTNDQPVHEDEVPTLPAEPISKRGDLWLLGDHRVLCGNSTCVTDLERLMDGEKADCIWTDPPYNVAYEGKTKDRLKIQNDAMDDDSFAQFLHDVFTTLSTCVRKGTTVYVAHADTYGEQFRAAFREAGFHLASCLVWRKNVMVLGRSDYQWRHEPILYGWMPGAAHYWDGGRRQTTVAETAGPEIVQLEDGSIQVQGVDNAYVIRGREINIETLVGSVITVDKPSRSADHPTTKPVELIERQLVNSCPPGSVVVDVFGGSGSTLIACNKIGRKARLMELDPRYVDVIVRRWEDLTGQKAVLCPQADDQNPQPSTTLKEPATGGAITSRNLVEFPAARSI
jgi:DNA modification methylase